MKIAVVAPTFPPDVCGVGDNASRQALAISALGHEVEVFTAQPRPAPTVLRVHSFPRPWSIETLSSVHRELAAFRPDAILIEYTPYLFTNSGGPLNLALPGWIYWLKSRLGARVSVYAHELHYPIEATPAGLVRGVPQLQAFWGILNAADRVLFTYERACMKARAMAPWRASRFVWQPIGPNIVPQTGPRPAAPTSDACVLLHFGTSHPTHLLSWTFDVLEAARKRHELGGRVRLVFAGIDHAKIAQLLEKEGRSYLLSSIDALGVVSAAEISDWFSRSTLVLAPLMDGISTRRSSIISALAHGAPVLTTSGSSTDPSLNWGNACVLTPVTSRLAYVETALEWLVTDGARRRELGRKGLNFYQAHFAWARIAEQMVAAITS